MLDNLEPIWERTKPHSKIHSQFDNKEDVSYIYVCVRVCVCIRKKKRATPNKKKRIYETGQPEPKNKNQYLFAPFHIRQVNYHGAVEAPRPLQSLVKSTTEVGGADNHNPMGLRKELGRLGLG